MRDSDLNDGDAVAAGSGASPAHDRLPAIPDHELLRRVGHGSYGEVWLGRNRTTNMLRAVKIVFRQEFEDKRPYEREFEGLLKFEPISRSHPSQLAILHVGRNDDTGCFYYVMELADSRAVAPDHRGPSGATPCRAKSQESGLIRLGTSDFRSYSPRTLRSELKSRGRLPVVEVVELGWALATALAHLHSHGLVHRDIKPANIVYVGGRPKLADIGLVTEASDTCSVVGTEGYISPEGPGSPQADLYSLGKVLYETATGNDRRDYPTLPDNLRSWPDAHHFTELNVILLRACRHQPRERYQTIAEMRDDLEWLHKGESIKRKRTTERRLAWTKKALTTFALLAVIGAPVLRLLSQFPPAPLPRQPNASRAIGRVDEGPASTNELANASYAHALLVVRADDFANLGAAYTNFLEATELDPNFAKAYAALFEMHCRERFVGMPPSTPQKLRELALKLHALAPALAATHNAMAHIHYLDWQFEEAFRACDRAIRTNPNYEFAHAFYGFILTHQGELQRGRQQLLEAAHLEPSKAVIQHLLGHYYFMRREYAKAIAQYEKSLRFKPKHGLAHAFIGRARQAMGQYREAIDEFEMAKLAESASSADEAATRESFHQLRVALQQKGPEGYWWEQLARTEKKPDSEFYRKAVIHMHLGHTNNAFYWLNRSFQIRERVQDGWDSTLNYLLFDESWVGVRDDPRFKKLLREIGFTRFAPDE